MRCFLKLAESTGLEPAQRFHVDGLAIRCITTLPTLLTAKTLIPHFFENVNTIININFATYN